MQDSLTSSFRCGETFDTAPYGGSPHPDERFTRREVDRACETRKKLRFLLACELKKQRVTRNLYSGLFIKTQSLQDNTKAGSLVNVPESLLLYLPLSSTLRELVRSIRSL